MYMFSKRFQIFWWSPGSKTDFCYVPITICSSVGIYCFGLAGALTRSLNHSRARWRLASWTCGWAVAQSSGQAGMLARKAADDRPSGVAQARMVMKGRGVAPYQATGCCPVSNHWVLPKVDARCNVQIATHPYRFLEK